MPKVDSRGVLPGEKATRTAIRPEVDGIVTLTNPAIIGGEESIFARLSSFSDIRRGIGV
jgi:hypothetical protein